MGYSEALEQQAFLSEKYQAAERELRAISNIGTAMHDGNEKLGRLFASLALQPVMFGETFYWSPAMCDLLDASSQTLPDWQCDPDQLIVPSAFHWLAKPFKVPGGSIIRAFGWTRLLDGSPPDASQVGGIACTFYADHQGAVVPTAAFPMETGGRLSTALIWRDGAVVPVDGVSAIKVKYFAAAVCLLEQRIIVGHDRQIERHARRRLQRRGWTQEPVVRVVELRRKSTSTPRSADPKTVEWSHQWVVSGHWRQQWYPTISAHQPIWILPYVKGPEDKPLSPPRAKVFAVVR